MKDISKILNEIAKDFVEIFRQALASKEGINEKVRKNTLINSNVYNQIDSDSNGKNMIRIYVNSYIDAINEGRRPYAPRLSIKDLRDWAERKNLPTDNYTLYLIREAIWRDGIKPRPVIELFYQMASKGWSNHLAKKLYDAIYKNLEENLLK